MVAYTLSYSKLIIILAETASLMIVCLPGLTRCRLDILALLNLPYIAGFKYQTIFPTEKVIPIITYASSNLSKVLVEISNS